MISIASCGYAVVTSACSASAVALAAPQVPRSAIEYDRSTSSATAADVRRSVSTTSKSSTASFTGPGPARSTALRTVRTTSSGCSSPYSQPREEPVSSPAAPASRTSWVPRPPESSAENTRRSAVAPEPPHRPRRSAPAARRCG